jgi:hypothetical protein
MMSVGWNDGKGGEKMHWTTRLFWIGLLVFLLGAGIKACSDPGPNGSTDGRYHTCGYVTEDGVTDHLMEYHIRCD